MRAGLHALTPRWPDTAIVPANFAAAALVRIAKRLQLAPQAVTVRRLHEADEDLARAAADFCRRLELAAAKE